MRKNGEDTIIGLKWELGRNQERFLPEVMTLQCHSIIRKWKEFDDKGD